MNFIIRTNAASPIAFYYNDRKIGVAHPTEAKRYTSIEDAQKDFPLPFNARMIDSETFKFIGWVNG